MTATRSSAPVLIEGVPVSDYAEPVFITKNGKGDLAVMSIKAYEELMGRFELCGLLQEGLDDVAEGNTRPLSDAIGDMKRRRAK